MNSVKKRERKREGPLGKKRKRGAERRKQSISAGEKNVEKKKRKDGEESVRIKSMRLLEEEEVLFSDTMDLARARRGRD